MNVCIVEDDSGLLASMATRLGCEADICVVYAAVSAEEALADCDWGRTDILLADIDLPGMSGIELIGKVRERHPAVQAMAFTICEDRETVFAALKAGAYGYVIKGDSPRVLVESLRQLHQGGSPMSPSIARHVIRDLHIGEGDDEAEPLLPPREALVLKYVADGLLYKEIADRLGVSTHTIHTHIKRIYAKLHAHGRRDALRKARAAGLLES
ncbi:MAG TPA: DNA-binding response regulator [Verrucomicrobia bacterium]|nr:DNA-binding response regulator [Verrucomicrobiota bacterium]